MQIEEHEWEWIGPEGNGARDRLLCTEPLVINGVMFHVEAWRVGMAVGNTQFAHYGDLDAIADALGAADKPFRTVEFWGEPYVIIISPYC